MPNCFQLIPRGDAEHRPAILTEVDAAMCQHFGEHPHATQWHNGWFDYIGFLIALGRTMPEIRRELVNVIEQEKGSPFWHHMLEIVDWLDANYETRSFYEHRRWN